VIIQEVIDTEWRGGTVVSVLHRFAHIKQFDRVAVLDRGRIVECDTPRTLLGRRSVYRDLYRAYHGGVDQTWRRANCKVP
jgi:ABC-type multidrug transport system fused ATPase/permease subunit